MAAQKALAIPEVLEIILLGVPARDLLVNAKRVSSIWSTSINTSPKIRKRLFLPTPHTNAVAPDSTGYVPEYRTTLRINPLLRTGNKNNGVARSPYGFFTNKLVKRDSDPDDLNHRRWIRFKALETASDGTENHFLADGTWKDMFLTEPPITTLYCSTSTYGTQYAFAEEDEGEFTVYASKGITAGILVELARKDVAAWRQSLETREFLHRQDSDRGLVTVWGQGFYYHSSSMPPQQEVE